MFQDWQDCILFILKNLVNPVENILKILSANLPVSASNPT